MCDHCMCNKEGAVSQAVSVELRLLSGPKKWSTFPRYAEPVALACDTANGIPCM